MDVLEEIPGVDPDEGGSCACWMWILTALAGAFRPMPLVIEPFRPDDRFREAALVAVR